MVRRMRAVNDYASALSGAINDSVTSVSVTSASGLPAEGDFYLAVDEEIILVTHVSGTTLTVIRGQEDTTATSHSASAGITGVTTAGYFEKLANEQRGILALPYGRITRWDGSSLSTLTSSDFTVFNSYPGSALSDGNDGVITYQAGRTGSFFYSAACRNFSPTSDWRITAHLSVPAFDRNRDTFALVAHDASDDSVRLLQLLPWLRIEASCRSSWTHTSPTIDYSEGVGGRVDLWTMFEIEWDTAESQDTLRGYWSKDGVHWYLAHTWTPTFASTVNVGIGVVARSSPNDMRSHILRWHEEALTF